MDSWTLALLIKPLGVLLWFVVIVVVPVALVALLRPLFPEGRVKDFLFRERGRHRAQAATGAGDGQFNSPTVSGRDGGENRAGLLWIRKHFD